MRKGAFRGTQQLTATKSTTVRVLWDKDKGHVGKIASLSPERQVSRRDCFRLALATWAREIVY
jgi:hypothetical protein